MADRKISDLTALTTPASGDFLPIVDISEAAAASKNKRITIEELMRGVPDGTAAAPGIAFENDPNTGIYSPGADQVAISTGGTGRLFVDGSGNLALGAASAGSYRQAVFAGNNANIAQFDSTAGNGGGIAFSQSGTARGSIGLGSNFITGATTTDLCISTGGNLLFNSGGGGSEKLRITSAGLVGIGTTSPSTYGANLAVYDGGGNGVVAIAQSTSNTLLQSNGQDFYINLKGSGSTVFRRGASDTESARLDGSGRLLVGTSSARSNVDYQFGSDSPRQQLELANGALGFSIIQNYDNGTAGTPAYLTLARAGSTVVGSTTIVANNNWLGEIDFAGSDGTDFTRAASIRCEVDGTPGANDMPGRLVFSTTADGSASPTERLSINSSGLVSITGELTSNGKIATNVAASVTSFRAVCNAGDQTATSLTLTSARSDVFYHIQAFNGATTECFRVEANGNTKNTNNSYGALSDAKIKENIVDATPKLVDLMQVKVRNYNLIGETTKQIGVVAQELESVFPAMVDENADRDENGNLLTTTTKGVKYSVFVPILIKALQEAAVKIESLEQRLSAAGIE